MRGVLLSLALVAGLGLFAPAADIPVLGSNVVTLEAAQQPDAPELNIDVDLDGEGAWYANPVWLAVGGLALLVLILIVVFAARGGGTTVIKD